MALRAISIRPDVAFGTKRKWIGRQSSLSRSIMTRSRTWPDVSPGRCNSLADMLGAYAPFIQANGPCAALLCDVIGIGLYFELVQLKPISNGEHRIALQDDCRGFARVLVEAELAGSRGKPNIGWTKIRQASRGGPEIFERLLVSSGLVVSISGKVRQAGGWKGSSRMIRFRYSIPFIRAAPMDEREAKAVVGEIRIELERAIILCAALGAPVQPLQYVCKHHVRVRQVGSSRPRVARVQPVLDVEVADWSREFGAVRLERSRQIGPSESLQPADNMSDQPNRTLIIRAGNRVFRRIGRLASFHDVIAAQRIVIGGKCVGRLDKCSLQFGPDM